MAAVPPALLARATPLRIGFEQVTATKALAGTDTLAVISFGAADAYDDPRHLVVPLHTADGSEPAQEVWRVDGHVETGREGDVVWAQGGGYLFVSVRVDEAGHGGPEGAAHHAYARLLDTVRALDYPHLLRAWNYLGDINLGDGDQERYRHFSVGRARGMGDWPPSLFPAATAIGHLGPRDDLLVYALASRTPGTPVENPRQVSAYHYPRRYGPVPPSFARAMRLDTDPASLLISGTASVIGHATAHVGNAPAQAAETLRNLDCLLTSAGLGTRLPGRDASLKAYVRHREHASMLRSVLNEAGVPAHQVLILQGDICRSDLLLEIDGIVTVDTNGDV